MRHRNPHAGLVIFWFKLKQRGYSRSITGLYRVLCVQTDNEQEFTKRLCVGKRTPTLFEDSLKKYGIEHKLIRPYTPRHNGKVERSHRKDNEYFYATHTFYSFDNFSKQPKVHNNKYNRFPMRPLNWKAPYNYIRAFLDMFVYFFCKNNLIMYAVSVIMF